MNTWSHGRMVLALVIIGLVSGASQAVAAPQEPAPAKDVSGLVSEARTAYDEERYEDAAVLLQQAYEGSKDPNILYNLARCYHRAKQYRKAIVSYQQYGNAAGTEDDKKTAKEKIQEVMREGELGWISVGVEGGESGALNGGESLSLPIQRRLLAAGSHSVVVVGAGGQTMQKRVTVETGLHTEATWVFESTSPAPVAAPIAQTPVAAAAPSDSVDIVSPSVTSPSGNTAAITVLVSSGVLLGAGGLFLGLAHADASNVKNADVNGSGVVTEISRVEALEHEEGAAWKSTAGVVALTAGGVGALVGTVMMLSNPKDTNTPDVSSWLSPDGGGLSVQGRF